MRRTVLSACFALAVWPGGPFAFSQSVAPAPSPPSQYSIAREVNLVVLPVTVTDRQGRFVSDLREANFLVYENGQAQKLTLFRHEDMPVTAGLVVDHSGSMGAKSPDVIAGAVAFVESSNPEDEVFVVNFNEAVSLGLPENVPFTHDVHKLKAALGRVSASGKTALYDALAEALQHLQGGTRDKKVLIVISDGGDNASKRTLDELLRMAQRSSATIYTIGLFDKNATDRNPRVLRKLAKVTGGKTYFPESAAEVTSLCRQIAADIRHQYTLGYVPSDRAAAGSFRTIRVATRAEGIGKLSVRTRTGYFAPSERRPRPGDP